MTLYCDLQKALEQKAKTIQCLICNGFRSLPSDSGSPETCWFCKGKGKVAVVKLEDVQSLLAEKVIVDRKQLSGHVRIVCAANPSFEYCEHCYQTERTECPTGKFLFDETVEDKSFVVVSRKEIENFPYLKCQKVKLEDADDYCSNEECENYRSCNWFWTVFKKELLEVSGVGKTHFYTVAEAREKLKEVSGKET